MEKDKIIFVVGLIIAILLFFYSLTSIYCPEKIKEKHEESLKNSNNIFSKYALKKSEKSKNNIHQRLTGFAALIMSIIMIYLFIDKLFS